MEENEIKFEKVQRVKDIEFDLPKKGSKYAAGYDFINPEEAIVEPYKVTYVKTGIKAKFPNDLALLLLNRSSNPKKKGLYVANGLGLIDADYYNNSDNEGEMCFAFTTFGDSPIKIEKGEKLGQGMFIKYYNISNFNADEVEARNSGLGSTGK